MLREWHGLWRRPRDDASLLWANADPLVQWISGSERAIACASLPALRRGKGRGRDE